MGKMYRALRLSGNVFEQKDISKRTLSENAQLTSLEKKALRRDSRNFEQKDISKRALSENVQMTLLKKIDSRLMDLGLGKNHISQQSMKELNKSLQRIDGFIVRPESFLQQKFKNTVNSVTNFKLNILPILLARRMFVLENINELVSRRKLYNLRSVVERISDISAKSSIEKILDDFQTKNSILKKEYRKIEKLRLNIYFEQQKFSPIFEELTERRDKKSKYFQNRESMTTLMMGILLVLLTILIATAPFVKIQVPNILNSTFFIILGFFFGQAIGRLERFKETKKLK